MRVPPPDQPPAQSRSGIGALVKKLLIAAAVVVTAAWIIGLVRLLAPLV